MPNKKRIAILPGDGIGPEIMKQGVRMLKLLQEPFDMELTFVEGSIGAAALKEYGTPLPQETLQCIQDTDAVLVGPVGDPAFEDQPEHLRPEQALVDLRIALGAFANMRSVRIYNKAVDSGDSTRVRNVDFNIIRDMRKGRYWREHLAFQGMAPGETRKPDYRLPEVTRTATQAFRIARNRKKNITVVYPAKGEGIGEWLELVAGIAAKHPDVQVDQMTTAACLDALEKDPFHFDVILSECTTTAAINDFTLKMTEKEGMLSSIVFGKKQPLIQPVHSTEGHLAGKNIANPIAMFYSVGMICEYAFGRPLAARNVEEAITTIMCRESQFSGKPIKSGKGKGTEEFSQYVFDEIRQSLSMPFLTV
ncbi:MAG TPA: isocitrate/isopropylmalate family dehydrogenase [Calditrichia bacterium]|nr:hypothetical protein [Calditrichota bacterium]HQU72755.1 isocitrate/isopropylmalate family dehydrogenase [Calditrichia bacterium]HQV31871.1 isocitrate/isopropylmalate family dehydrogenase [Calditrichia bacterium]